MLVPSAPWGKPLHFQTTKRTILTVVGVAVLAVALVIGGSVYTIGSTLFGGGDSTDSRRNTVEQRTEIAGLKEENRHLKTELDAQIEQTRQRIIQVNRLISRISTFTGLPLVDEPATTVAVTTDSAHLEPANGLGRGGPLSYSPEALAADLLGHGYGSYAKAREILLFDLDSVVVQLERGVRHLRDQEELLANTPLICPVQGEYRFTDRFGGRMHPLYRREHFHAALDIAAPHGKPIIAPADGTVTYAGYDKAKGRTLTIDHGTGLYPRDGVPSKRHFKTRYCHCARILVKKGSKVKRGDVIALVGSTGTSTGNHLHYEVRVDGRPVDPEYFILNGQ